MAEQPNKQNLQKNLGFVSLVQLDWSKGKRAESLDIIYRHLSDDAVSSINWYLTKKDAKKTCAIRLRVAAMILATLGVLSTLLAGAEIFSALWSSMFLVLAGALVSFDYFFGCSSAWSRFLDTELKIRTALKEFQLEWETYRATMKEAEPSDEDVKHQLELARTFLDGINLLLRKEMDAWMEEFRAALARMDRSVQREEGKSGKGGSGGGKADGGTTPPAGH